MMFAIRNKTGALLALGVCVLALASQVECDLLAQLERLIKVPYPASCSASHVNHLFYMQSSTLAFWSTNHDETDEVKSKAIGRFNSYLQLLHAYCHRLLDMKLSTRENLATFKASYEQVTDIIDTMVQIQRANNVESLPAGVFLRHLAHYLAGQAATSSISKQEALVNVKEAAKKLGRLINVEIAPVMALEMIAHSVAPGANQRAQEVSSALTRKWAQISEQCNKIRLTSIDSRDKLKLSDHLDEDEDDEAEEEELEEEDEAHSPLVPLNAHAVRQVTLEEGYKREFDQLASGR